MFRTVSLSWLLILALNFAAYGQGPPQWKLQVGDRFYVEESAHMKMRLTADGEVADQEVQATILSRVSVAEQDADGNVVVEQFIESAKSGTPGSLESNPTLEGAVFRMTFNPSMEVIGLDGYDDLVHRLADFDPLAEDEIRATLSADEMQRRLSEPFNVYLPDQAVNGEVSWTRGRNVTLGPLGSANMVFRYTSAGEVRSDHGSMQVLAFTADGSYAPPTADFGDYRIVRGDLKIQGIRGTVLFDSADGRLAQLNVQLPLEGTFTLAADDEETTVHATIDLNQTIRVLEHAPTAGLTMDAR